MMFYCSCPCVPCPNDPCWKIILLLGVLLSVCPQRSRVKAAFPFKTTWLPKQEVATRWLRWVGGFEGVVDPAFPYVLLRCLKQTKQECIPVGCVPPACCPYLPTCTARGGYLPRGVYLPRGCTCLRGCTCWGCTCWGGVPAQGGYLPRGGCTCLGR